MIETALDIARDHPAYQGHFPGHPILPAVVLLAEILALLEHEFTVSNAKFMRAVEPGTPLVLAHEPQGAGVRFEVRAPGGVVASGVLVPRGTA